MIEGESFEQKTIILVHPVVQREQGAHLSYQGERHKSLIPLERIEGVELGEAFL